MAQKEKHKKMDTMRLFKKEFVIVKKALGKFKAHKSSQSGDHKIIAQSLSQFIYHLPSLRSIKQGWKSVQCTLQ
jgi:hypothetical protein